MSQNKLSDDRKVQIVSDFILQSPPGEFNEVFNDVRCLLNDDDLLKQRASGSFAQYNKDQMLPVALPGCAHSAMVTSFNDLGSSRFYDPRSKQSFRFNHLTKEVTDIKSVSTKLPAAVESLRRALDDQLCGYISCHYKLGTCAVFAAANTSPTVLHMCIEDHEFQPKNYWNGRWRSQWSVTVAPQSSGAAADTAAICVSVSGVLRVQVHYYEDGNVQLVSSKEIQGQCSGSDDAHLAKEVIQFIEKSENEYQLAIGENYQTMSDTTFKALRRQLPVTRSKIDWTQIVQYRIGKELRQ